LLARYFYSARLRGDGYRILMEFVLGAWYSAIQSQLTPRRDFGNEKLVSHAGNSGFPNRFRGRIVGGNAAGPRTLVTE
jgi:hypothetical protein